MVNHVTSFNWTISPVTLETEANISCVAINDVSEGGEDSIAIEVFAPPTFIVRLPPYTGSIADADNVSLVCQVESSPTREIQWFKDGIPIEGNSDQYTIHSREIPPNFSTNDFESVTSTLIWNLENWPAGRLDRNLDNSNYSCQSLSNEVGGGVSSTTYFRVEYQPENLYISEETVDVVENELPTKVLCTAEAYPKASFMWRFNDEVIQTHNLLHFGSPVTREQAGEYVCEAQNRHGTTQIHTNLNVQYKPECNIRQSKGDDEILLTCDVVANPDTVTFFWKKGNGTFTGNVVDDGRTSTAHIELVQESFGTYYCFVNNTVGQGVPCEIDIQGIGILKSVTDFDIIIIIAVCAAALVALLILVAIIIIICRKKRTNDKYGNNHHEDLADRENHNSGKLCNALQNSSQVKPIHKWPLRPGVHVHVNGLDTLAGNDCNKVNQISGFSYGAKNSSSSSSASDSVSNASSNPDTGGCDTHPRGEVLEHDSSAMEHSQAGMVTSTPSYAQVKVDQNSESRPHSRKRKRKDDANKSSPDSGHPDDLLPPTADKAFYENLPFHGLKKPPPQTEDLSEQPESCTTDLHKDLANKSSDSSSRPSSQLSTNGSSGYGSTRSNMDPNSHHPPDPSTAKLSSQKDRFGTLRGTKPFHNHPPFKVNQKFPQYSSLRIPNRMKTEPCVPDSAKLDLAEAEVDSNPDLHAEAAFDSGDGLQASKDQDFLLDYPIPAPRTPKPSLPTYMNLPKSNKESEILDPQILTSLNHYQSLPRHLARVSQRGAGGGCSRLLPTLPTMYDASLPTKYDVATPGLIPSRTVSYFSTLDPRAMSLVAPPHRTAHPFTEISAEMITPPKQFDSYYYHPSTLRVQPHSIGHQPVLQTVGHHASQKEVTFEGYCNGAQPRSAQQQNGPMSQLEDFLVGQGVADTIHVGPNGERICYADLAIQDQANGIGAKREQRISEYAMLKFNPNKNVSTEIDV